MTPFLIVSNALLWLLVLCLGYYLLGTLRALGILNWRLEQFNATSLRRPARDGLRRGAKAPDFTLPTVQGGELSLRDGREKRTLLVFSAVGCSPCHAIAPELNRLHREGGYRVLVVLNAKDDEACRKWVAEVSAEFPVLLQKDFKISRRYQVFATPFAFVVSPAGIITSKGVIGTPQYLGFVLTGVADQSDSYAHESEENPVGDGKEPLVTSGKAPRTERAEE